MSSFKILEDGTHSEFVGYYKKSRSLREAAWYCFKMDDVRLF